MRRVIVLSLTGRRADNLTAVKRVARKIRRSVGMGQCVLVDCEDVEMPLPALECLAAEAHPERVKFCGLSIADQLVLKHLINRRQTPQGKKQK
jgi:hypothetical protein